MLIGLLIRLRFVPILYPFVVLFSRTSWQIGRYVSSIDKYFSISQFQWSDSTLNSFPLRLHRMFLSGGRVQASACIIATPCAFPAKERLERQYSLAVLLQSQIQAESHDHDGEDSMFELLNS